jgi:hypothetical protein
LFWLELQNIHQVFAAFRQQITALHKIMLHKFTVPLDHSFAIYPVSQVTTLTLPKVVVNSAIGRTTVLPALGHICLDLSNSHSSFSSISRDIPSVHRDIPSVDSRISSSNSSFSSVDSGISSGDSRQPSVDSGISSTDSGFSSVDSRISSGDLREPSVHSNNSSFNREILREIRVLCEIHRNELEENRICL